MRVQASAMAVALVSGALVSGALVAGAPGAAAQESGNVLVIQAEPTARARVSKWLSSWRANGGEVKGEAARIGAADGESPKAKTPRRTASKTATRASRKAKPLKEAGRPAKTARTAAKPAAPPAVPVAIPVAIPVAKPNPPGGATAPAPAAPAAEPAPPPARVQVAPAYAAPPQAHRVPPSQALRSPLADIPAATLFAPPALAGALAAAPALTPDPKPLAPESPPPPATSRLHKQPDAVDEATWWRTEGEPAIVIFRDCIAAFAGREAPRRPDSSVGELVIAAGAGDCRTPFEAMMTTLTLRYGRERLESAMGPLLNEMLLPAARAAAADAARTASGSPPAP
jgi:hypothetical protein